MLGKYEQYIYMLMWYERFNGSGRERTLHARAAAAVWSARCGRGSWVLVEGLRPNKIFLDQVKLNVFAYLILKKQHAFRFETTSSLSRK